MPWCIFSWFGVVSPVKVGWFDSRGGVVMKHVGVTAFVKVYTGVITTGSEDWKKEKNKVKLKSWFITAKWNLIYLCWLGMNLEFLLGDAPLDFQTQGWKFSEKKKKKTHTMRVNKNSPLCPARGLKKRKNKKQTSLSVDNLKKKIVMSSPMIVRGGGEYQFCVKSSASSTAIDVAKLTWSLVSSSLYRFHFLRNWAIFCWRLCSKMIFVGSTHFGSDWFTLIHM